MDTKFQLKFLPLGNKEWLEDHYINQQLSLTQIAKVVGCTYTGVRNAIIRNGIIPRTRGEGLRNVRRCGEDHFCFNKSVITGNLLGDGGLSCQNKWSNDSFPFLSIGTIHYDHALFIARQLFAKESEKRIKERINKDGFSGHGAIFRITTLCHEELVPLFNQWYPKENCRKKVIPKSLELDPTVLLHWFLGDGYSYWVKGRKETSYLRVQFATQCFQKNDLDWLSENIKKKFGLLINPRFHQRHGKIKGSGYFMELSTKKEQIAQFYELIGTAPVVSMAYKWKQPQSNLLS
jgi:LAGLIDADG DNA endonuclease family